MGMYFGLLSVQPVWKPAEVRYIFELFLAIRISFIHFFCFVSTMENFNSALAHIVAYPPLDVYRMRI